MYPISTYHVILGALVLFTAPGFTAEDPDWIPYVQTDQLEIPAGKRSVRRQPWRAYTETVSGHRFLRGVGLYYKHIPHNADDAAVIKLIADCGFQILRIAPHANIMSWDNSQVSGREIYLPELKACRKYGVRPQLVLIGHAYQPVPVRRTNRKVMKAAAVGARTLTLDNVDDLVEGYSGISHVTGYHSAGVLFTKINRKTGVVTLSMPLPKAFQAGVGIQIATLRVLPLFPVGYPQFEATADQFLAYENAVLDWVEEAGLEEFNLELWAGLHFPDLRKFVVGINEYYDPPLVEYKKNPFEPGGHIHELSRRMADLCRRRFPKARIIWNFTDNRFSKVNPALLPQQVDTLTWSFYDIPVWQIPKTFPPPDLIPAYLEQPLPAFRMVPAEGFGHLFINGDSLIPFLEPRRRRAVNRARGRDMSYYISALGFAPGAAGVKDPKKAHELKAKFAARALLFWLNKGMSGVLLHSAYDRSETSWTVLYGRAPTSRYATLPRSETLSPTLATVRNLTRTFGNSRVIKKPRQLRFDLRRGTGDKRLPSGVSLHDALAILPFQTASNRFVIAVYVMTTDLTETMEEEPIAIAVSKVRGRGLKVRLYDPLLDKWVRVKIGNKANGRLQVTLPVVDYPRLLVLEETK